MNDPRPDPREVGVAVDAFNHGQRGGYSTVEGMCAAIEALDTFRSNQPGGEQRHYVGIAEAIALLKSTRGRCSDEEPHVAIDSDLAHAINLLDEARGNWDGPPVAAPEPTEALHPEEALTLLDALGELYGMEPPDHWNAVGQDRYGQALEGLVKIRTAHGLSPWPYTTAAHQPEPEEGK